MNASWTPNSTLVADGQQLEYACYGPPPQEAPTIVLLHEGLGCIALWRDLPQKLAQATGFGVLVYSRAGYGQSEPVQLPRPLNYMTHEARMVLPDVLAAVAIESCILVGHSDGASIAAIYGGSDFRPTASGLVLIAPHFFTEAIGLQEIASAKAAFDTGDLRARLAKYHNDPDNAFRGWNDAWLNPDFKAWNIESMLNSITTPILAIQGREDPYGSLKQIEAITKRIESTLTLVIDSCKHAPHIEHEEIVVTTIADFCTDVVSRSDFTTRNAVNNKSIVYPDHAYVPGQNERHPDDLFDTVKRSVSTNLSAKQLSETEAFITGLAFLKNGYYWESHEVFEVVWMALPEASAEKRFVQCLIQLANARLKLKMDKPKAAQRLVGLCRELLPEDQATQLLGIEIQLVSYWIEQLEK